MKVLALTDRRALVLALSILVPEWEVEASADLDGVLAATGDATALVIEASTTAEGLARVEELEARGVRDLAVVVVGDQARDEQHVTVVPRPFTVTELRDVVRRAVERRTAGLGPGASPGDGEPGPPPAAARAEPGASDDGPGPSSDVEGPPEAAGPRSPRWWRPSAWLGRAREGQGSDGEVPAPVGTSTADHDDRRPGTAGPDGTEPEPEPADPEPVPTQPEPEDAGPEPVPTQPEPVPTQPEPEDAEPGPVPAAPEPEVREPAVTGRVGVERRGPLRWLAALSPRLRNPTLPGSDLRRRVEIAAEAAADLEDLLREAPALARPGQLARVLTAELVHAFDPETVTVWEQGQDGTWTPLSQFGLTPAEARMRVPADHPLFAPIVRELHGILLEPTDLARGLLAGVAGTRTEAVMAAPVATPRRCRAIVVVGAEDFGERDLKRLLHLTEEAAPGLALATTLAGLVRDHRGVDG